jgi:phage tail sheath protein FI
MTYPTSPGVYPREVDQSLVISSAANSIGGIVINADKGPTGELNLVTNNKQFIDTYGEPTPSNPSMYSALAFLEQGKRLLVARAISDAAAATVEADDTTATKAFDVSAINEGAWGNSLSLNITCKLATITLNSGGGSYAVGDVLTVSTGAGTLAQVVVTGVTGGVIDTISFVDGGEYTTLPPTLTDIATTTDGGGTGATVDVTVSDKFNMEVLLSGAVVETYEDLTRNTLSKDGFGKSQYIEDVISVNSEYIVVVDDLTNDYTASTVAPITGSALTTGSNDTTAPNDAQINVAWDLFQVKEEVEVSLLINAGWATQTVQNKMITLAEARGDCMAILDFPSSDTTVTSMLTYRKATLNADTSFAAIYGGYVYIYDQYNDKYLYVPPSGYVAGVYAGTAQSSEVWYAPAGVRRGVLNVLGVETVFTEGERDSLYTAGINPIQNFTGEGVQVYGQKTLQSFASATDRVNVRLLLIQIEKSVSRSLRPFVFEFNDIFTRENISSIMNSYMEDIKVRRGVYDYKVVCDDTNNTEQVIDTNKLIVDLYVKPTRVAEFVQLNVVVTSSGVTFTS